MGRIQSNCTYTSLSLCACDTITIASFWEPRFVGTGGLVFENRMKVHAWIKNSMTLMFWTRIMVIWEVRLDLLEKIIMCIVLGIRL